MPELDWGTRMHQMEEFLGEMGHLRVDPNYSMYGNLGGWAVQMSELHKRWCEDYLGAANDWLLGHDFEHPINGANIMWLRHHVFWLLNMHLHHKYRVSGMVD